MELNVHSVRLKKRRSQNSISISHVLLHAEGLSVALVFCGLSSGWPLCTGCQNRSAPSGDQVWTVARNCAYSCGPHAFSWLVDDWLKLFTRPLPDSRGGFLDNCCLIQ
eukprot:1152554-Pelagomonas_calceolata.AAC.6